LGGTPNSKVPENSYKLSKPKDRGRKNVLIKEGVSQ